MRYLQQQNLIRDHNCAGPRVTLKQTTAEATWVERRAQIPEKFGGQAVGMDMGTMPRKEQV